MSHTPKTPTPSYTTATLPTDLPEGSVVFDSTEQKLVSFKNGSWNTIGGGVGSTTYVRDNVAGVIDQVEGNIPDSWKANDTSLKGLVIGTSCTSIEGYAFSFCGGLTGSLVIPDSVTSIGNNAFYNCSGLNGSLTIGNSVTTIGNNAFRSCTGLTGSLTIGNSVTTIGNQAFYACSGLNGSLTIPNSVTSIGVAAFGNCSGLTNVDCYVNKSVLDVTSSLLGSGVTTIHVRSTDSTWTAGSGQTIGGKINITVIKDL